MPNVEYECIVNKTHPKKTFSVVQNPPPICCGRFMVQIAAPQQAAPQQQPAPMAQIKEPAITKIAKKPWWKGLLKKTN